MLLSTGTAAVRCVGQTVDVADGQQPSAFLKQLLIIRFKKSLAIK